MNILIIHNYYLHRGGEDVSTESEMELLRKHGHNVIYYHIHNEQISRSPALYTAFSAIWSVSAFRKVKYILASNNIDIMHCQNIFPLISPSVYYASKLHRVPVVQSVRNYRMYCLNGLFYCNNEVCERCYRKVIAWPGVVRKCYKNRLSASLVVALMLFMHHFIFRSWKRNINGFIALSSFVRLKLIESGIPACKVFIKPNFAAPDTNCGQFEKNQFIYVGRLSVEKGVETILKSVRVLNEEKAIQHDELLVIGDGPDRRQLELDAEALPVRFLGHKLEGEVYNIIGQSKFLIFPSEWYETFGRVAIEAFAKNVPVIASNIGAIAELVEPGVTGLLFEPGNHIELAARIEWALMHPDEMRVMGKRARKVYEEKYTAERNYEQIMAIYSQCLERNG